jgi:uncharacterized protein YukE
MPPPLAVDPSQLAQLATAALTTARALEHLAAGVRASAPDGAAVYGDGQVGPSMATFQTLWTAEARLTADAAQEFADGLRQAADSYRAADAAALRRMRIA